jgi:hypothetical protein
MSTAAAQSFLLDETPAVIVPLFLNTEGRAASFSSEVPPGYSSVSKVICPFFWGKDIQVLFLLLDYPFDDGAIRP